MKQQREGTEQERLVGRKEEVRRVLDIVERVQSNVQRGAAVLVTGEAGIGKTEFADHLRRSLKLRGHAILECTCRPRDDRPNGVFIELFARGIQLVSDGGYWLNRSNAHSMCSGMVRRGLSDRRAANQRCHVSSRNCAPSARASQGARCPGCYHSGSCTTPMKRH